MKGKTVEVEHSTPEHIIASLARRGHDVRWAPSGSFGRGQIIWRDNKSGVLAGDTEPRTDGPVASW